MKQLVLNLPTLGFVVATRAALGVGIGLLISERMNDARRRRTGYTLLGIGAATTIPAAWAVMRGLGARRAGEALMGCRMS